MPNIRKDMLGGKYDSSKTRVRPLSDALWSKGRDWPPRLLALPAGGCADAQIKTGDLTLVEGHWEPHEKCLDPPVSLLSWLIRNPSSLKSSSVASADWVRQRLTQGDPQTVEKALRLLRTEKAFPAWYIFEGPTWPDVNLVAYDALVVVEGKRTELSSTIETKWLNGRHQIWRRIDAAWELRGKRAVYASLSSRAMRRQPMVRYPKHGKRPAKRAFIRSYFAPAFPIALQKRLLRFLAAI